MLLIVGTFRMPAAALESGRPIMSRMAEASRLEDGCLEYGYAEDVLDPGLIHVKELWMNQEALDQHLASPHLARWRATWSELGIGGRDLRVYDVGEPRST